MGWTTPRTWADGEIVSASYFETLRDLLDYLKGAQTDQTSIELQTALQTTELGADTTASQLRLRNEFTSTASTFGFVAEKDAAVANADRCDIDLALSTDAGSETYLASIRCEREASESGSVAFHTYTGGAINATPALRLRRHAAGTFRVGVQNAAPSYECDVTGTVNATTYDNLNLWRESPVGTQYFSRIAEVSSQWQSTVVTGTSPLQVTSTTTVANLHADSLSGETWVSASLSNTGSQSVATKDTTYTVATFNLAKTGYHILIGEVSITVAAGDTAATFSATVTGGAGTAKARSGTASNIIQLSVFALYTASSGSTINLQVTKNAGTGSSTAAGSLVGCWIGP